jgi:hypothetical protein
LPNLFIDLDVGSSEPIDALLRVTNHEQGSLPQTDGPPIRTLGWIGSEQEAHLGLQRVGVLELVDEQAREPPPQLTAGGPILAQ